MHPVTLEITVSPTDWRHAVHVLPHQLRQWASQVDEVQLTLNLLQTQGRYGGATQGLAVLHETLEDLCDQYPHARVVEVDYSPAMQAEVGERFFDGRPFPLRNHDGGPFYSYFFGWHAARNDMVLHADSDMLFGGGSQTWIGEALTLMATEPGVLCTAPLPGPPTPDGSLPDHVREQHAQMGGDPEWLSDVRGYRLHGCSTRLWLFDRATLSSRLQGIPLERPRLRSAVRSRLEGNPPFELPERSMSRRMNQLGLRRIDFLGADAGMWSLHPTMRSEVFYKRLPSMIAQVEAGEMPVEQLGDYNINDSLVDWTTARQSLRRQTWYRRLARRAAAPVVGGLRRAVPRR